MRVPVTEDARETGDRTLPPAETALSRRQAVMAGLLAAAGLAVTGCAGARRSTAGLSPAWPELEPFPERPTRQRPEAEPLARTPHPVRPEPGAPSGVTRRSAWAKGRPIPSRMDRLGSVDRITVHHDGMPPATLRSSRDVAERIELIRTSHRRRGWGDIGYHFIVDPHGRIWQGRPLHWQGAHVGGQNQRNLGVLALGNFEVQTPTQAQVRALEQFIAWSMREHRVSPSRLHTHRELAPALCPGRKMQRVMNALRSRGGSLASL